MEAYKLLTPTEVQFSFAEVSVMVPPLVSAMIGDECCWALVVAICGGPHRYVQLGLPAKIPAVLEAVADFYLDPDEALSDYEHRALSHLGWPAAEVGFNHQLLPALPLSAYDLACRMLATLQLAFGCNPATVCKLELIKWKGTRAAA